MKLSTIQAELLYSIRYRVRHEARTPTFDALKRAGLIRRGTNWTDPRSSLSWVVTAAGKKLTDGSATPTRTSTSTPAQGDTSPQR